MGLRDILAIEKWRESGKYMPPAFRDFHDQKDLFKTIHETINVEGHEYVKDISWVAGQVYVIDIFLWFMALHGYTLQKSRAKLDFHDIDEAIAATKERRFAGLKSLLSGDT